MHRSHMLFIGRLALLVCLWTTGDQVIDMVFEAPDAAFDNSASTEEPDNAAEHVLMPSQRADTTTDVVVADSADFGASSHIVTASGDPTRIAVPSVEYPPRNSVISFSVPLRI